MNIVFLVSSLNCGGAERVAITLCNAWSLRGHKVSLVVTYLSGEKPFYAVSKRVNIIQLADLINLQGNSFINYFKKLKSIRVILKTAQPDIIISFLPNVNIATILASMGLTSPLVVCERNYYQDVPWHFRLVSKLLYRYADTVLAQTARARDDLILLYPNIQHAHYIYNPLPEEIYSLSKIQKSHSTKTLICFGRLVEQKQMHVAIEAFAKIAHAIPDWQLHIYGNGPLKPLLQRHISSLNMQNKIVLQNATTNPWQKMLKADALIMTSQYEGFPNSLLEAMALGLPCISFDCPYGPRELSDNGNNILLINLNDTHTLAEALLKLLTDKEFSARLSLRAAAFSKNNFNLNKILEEWDNLFIRLGLKP